jgi:hypothetical protein
MVRFDVNLEEITKRVKAIEPTWLDRAADRTQAFIAAGKFDETSSIWSQIKEVFIALQNNKCAYCEKDMAGAEYGSGEYDLEHFRPKGRVQVWSGSDGIVTGPASANGYYWLAYDLANYAVACKSCNSGLKLDRFPISGHRISSVMSITNLNQAEKPLLIFPIGQGDDDPRALIGFDGPSPQAKSEDPHKKNRARVTIEFFQLASSDTREELYLGRCRQIVLIWPYLQTMRNKKASQKNKKKAEEMITSVCSSGSAHSSCVNAFVELSQHDHARAKQFFELSEEYVKKRAARSSDHTFR